MGLCSSSASHRARLAALASGVALFACSCGRGPPLQRSCEGRPVDTCDPYEYAEVAAATFGPSGLSPGDPRTSAMVHVELRTCGGSTPAAPAVQIAALVSGASSPGLDAGDDGTRLYQLTAVTAADATSTAIDATIDNPFDTIIPANTDILLRFTPVIGGCEGGALTIPYRTGARPDP